MKKVYILKECYCDCVISYYITLGVYTDRDKAEYDALILEENNQCSYTDYSVETWEVNEETL